MAFFARKLRYAGSDDEAGGGFIALIELAKKKGGKTVGFVLYCYIVQYGRPKETRIGMLRFNAETHEEAEQRFESKVSGECFQGHQPFEKRWEKTTEWLCDVAVGGWHACGEAGRWVRVGLPAPWSKRRPKKKALVIGNISHILLAQQALLSNLELKQRQLEVDLSFLEEGNDEDYEMYPPVDEPKASQYADIEEELARVNEELAAVTVAIAATKAEMRFMVRRMFPTPMGITPTRDLRRQRQRDVAKWV